MSDKQTSDKTIVTEHLSESGGVESLTSRPADSQNLPKTNEQNDPFEGETPEIQGLLEKAMELEMEIQSAISSSKATGTKQAEIRVPLKEIMKIVMQQQVMIGRHLMGRLSTETRDRVPTFADVVSTLIGPPPKARARSRSKQRREHNVMIYPREEGSTSEQTKEIIQSKIIPSQIEVKVNNVKPIGRGGIVINTPTSEDIDKLILEFQKRDEIREKFDFAKPKLKDPSIVIFNVNEDLSKEEFIEGLKSQNEELIEANLVVRTSYKSRFRKNWVVSMNPEAFNLVIKKPRINLNWSRLTFKENFRILKCFRCAKYGHTAERCRSEEFKESGLCLCCGTKGHKERECQDSPKCINCSSHKAKFKTTYDTDHSARSNNCKIRDKEIYLLISRTNYGQKLAALKISFGKNEWLLVSIYCPPSHDFEEDLDNLIPVLIQNQDVKTLILGDFNAKSQYGDQLTRIREVTDL
ncbi:hypothetical protein AVEN_110404-1 [Araneus ventricosus]|uniref:CCHC-type domain-containing protein n=1 Tax=Araneus ventricosus TaxID=182803 RepID=A0A4Y2PAZ1_ARAVE|nr:hypothetical protein AVEN_110404-1 [Araneus ventricosus]